jgi:hypothetical protein
MAITKYTEIITQTIERLLPNLNQPVVIDTSKFATKEDILNSIKPLLISIQNIEKTLNEFKKKAE